MDRHVEQPGRMVRVLTLNCKRERPRRLRDLSTSATAGRITPSYQERDGIIYPWKFLREPFMPESA